MWFTLVASWAEYERDLISRRTREKMALARASGVHLGRPRKLSIDQVRAAQGRIANGNPVSREARRLGVSCDTLRRAMSRYRFAA
jgi:DNA invertase Pin-like site-specific DNA recombinase